MNLKDRRSYTVFSIDRGNRFHIILFWHKSGLILGMDSASQRRRYNVTSSLIGWAHIQNDPCQCTTLRAK